MWLTVLKTLAVAWLVIGLAVLVVVGVRRSRSNRGNPNWYRRPGGQPGHVSSMSGIMPNTPLPEWIDWTDDQHVT